MGNSGFRWLGYVGIRVKDTTNSAILQATFSALAMPVQYPGGKRGWVWILNMQHQQAFAFVRTLTSISVISAHKSRWMMLFTLLIPVGLTAVAAQQVAETAWRLASLGSLLVPWPAPEPIPWREREDSEREDK